MVGETAERVLAVTGVLDAVDAPVWVLTRQGVAAGAADDVLTAGNLSDTFGLPLELARTDGRFTARRARCPSTYPTTWRR